MTRTVPHRPHTLAAAPFEVKIAVSLGPAVPGDRTLPALGCSRGLGTIQTGYSCSSARVQIEHLCERMRNELHGIAPAAFRRFDGLHRMEDELPASCGATRSPSPAIASPADVPQNVLEFRDKFLCFSIHSMPRPFLEVAPAIDFGTVRAAAGCCEIPRKNGEQ